MVYEKMMKPNIRQRETHRRNRDLRYRKKAAEEFDEAVYRYRGLIEGIFGAIEAGKGLKTRCRLRRMQRKWGVATAIGHNLAVLNRLKCAKTLNITLKPILANHKAQNKRHADQLAPSNNNPQTQQTKHHNKRR